MHEMNDKYRIYAEKERNIIRGHVEDAAMRKENFEEEHTELLRYPLGGGYPLTSPK